MEDLLRAVGRRRFSGMARLFSANSRAKVNRGRVAGVMGSDDSPPPAAARREVRASRISTRGGGAARDESVSLALEAALTVDVQGVESYTLLCTPGDDLALTAGFLLSEGIVDGMDDVAELRACDDDTSIVRVRLKQRVPRIHEPGRNLLIVSSCGLCGAAGLDEKLAALPEVGDSLRVEATTLRLVGERMRSHQPLFEACGSTHAACIFSADGEILASAEDCGRHNALDKAIGKTLLAGGITAGRGAMLSGRVSLEMVGKCARAGIELITAVSAPTSLAVEIADRCRITLCAYVRETRATVFTHQRRVATAAG
jgi:FdhD protein